jgi:hypothetical protein
VDSHQFSIFDRFYLVEGLQENLRAQKYQHMMRRVFLGSKRNIKSCVDVVLFFCFSTKFITDMYRNLPILHKKWLFCFTHKSLATY